jgi:hypothetical protein
VRVHDAFIVRYAAGAQAHLPALVTSAELRLISSDLD